MEISDKKVFYNDLEAFCIEAMLQAGMRQEEARITAEVLVTTDMWGTFTHGSKQLRGLLKNFRDKRMDPQAEPELVSQGPGWALLDGHMAMSMVTSYKAMETAIAKAKDTGIAFTAARNSGHFGAAGFYAHMAAKENMVGICMSNVDPGVSVPGSRTALLGTNPIAYAVPAGKEKAVFLDIATSVVAASKIYAARDMGKSIPNNWLIDKDGLPTTDPGEYPKVGAVMPMAGHKGYGIALLVEILTGVIAGGAFFDQVISWILEIPDPVNQSHAFIAINIDAVMPIEQFKDRMDKMIQGIKDAPKAKGTDRIYLPGEMEWDKLEKAKSQGMQLPQDVLASLNGVAQDYNLDINKIFA